MTPSFHFSTTKAIDIALVVAAACTGAGSGVGVAVGAEAGAGAVRECCDLVLTARGDYAGLLAEAGQ